MGSVLNYGAMTAPRYGNLLAAYLKPQRRRVALLGGLMLVGLAADLGSPLILRAFIDMAVQGAALETLFALAGLFLVVAFATQGLAVAEAYVAQNVGLTATNRLRADLTRHLLDLD